MKKLQGRSAVVTGAGRGVGRRAAIRLGALGAQVVLVSRTGSQLEETARVIEQAGGRAATLQLDLGQLPSPEALRRSVSERFGPPSILINAAGVSGPLALVKDGDPAGWIATMATNMLGPYLTCRAFVGGMIEAGWGRIINVSSAASLLPPGPMDSAYATSKAALNQFTRHLAAELVGTGVTANVIHPGDVKTEMWADIRNGVDGLALASGYRQWVDWVASTGGDDPDKAADLIERLMGDAAGTVNGQFLWIEDGLRAPLPSW